MEVPDATAEEVWTDDYCFMPSLKHALRLMPLVDAMAPPPMPIVEGQFDDADEGGQDQDEANEENGPRPEVTAAADNDVQKTPAAV